MDCLMSIINRFIGSAVSLPKGLTIVSELAEYMSHFAIKNFGEADDMLHEETDTVAEFWMAETGKVHRQSRNSMYGWNCSGYMWGISQSRVQVWRLSENVN